MKKGEKKYYAEMTSIEKEMLDSCYNKFYGLVSPGACKDCNDISYCAQYDVVVIHNNFEN
jgi:hypothetical protein